MKQAIPRKGNRKKGKVYDEEESHLETVIDLEVLRREQASDEYLQRIWRLAQDEEVKARDIQEEQDSEHLRKVTGVMVKDIMSETGEYHPKTVVPLSLQFQVVKEVHGQSHPGIRGTCQMLKRHYWFRVMKRVVKDTEEMLGMHRCQRKTGGPGNDGTG